MRPSYLVALVGLLVVAATYALFVSTEAGAHPRHTWDECRDRLPNCSEYEWSRNLNGTDTCRCIDENKKAAMPTRDAGHFDSAFTFGANSVYLSAGEIRLQRLAGECSAECERRGFPDRIYDWSGCRCIVTLRVSLDGGQ